MVMVIFCTISVHSGLKTDWYLQEISYYNTPIPQNGRNITIALIDSGTDINNSQLWKNNGEQQNSIDDDHNGYVNDFYGWNFVTNSNDITDQMGPNGHGTIMTTLIEKVNSNAKIMPLIVLTQNGTLYSNESFIKAFQYAINKKADIIVCAIYFTNLTSSMISVVEQAEAHNIVVITSSGNYATCQCNHFKINALGSVGATMTVGAIDQSLRRADFSQFGEGMDIMAPGTNIVINNIEMDGTSMATAIVSGAESLLQELNFNNSFTTQTLLRTATDINATGYDYYTGYGILNISLALEVIQDREVPEVKVNNDNLIITDNIGLYRIESTSENVRLQGQNRTIILQHVLPNQEIEIQDLAGNSILYKTNPVTKSHSLKNYNLIFFISTIILLSMFKKIKKGIKK